MGFLWISLLGLLVLIPLLVFAYRRSLRGTSKHTLLYSDLNLVAVAAKTARPWRHLPALIYGLAITFALVAFARPTAKLLVPDDISGVILAIETGRSMSGIDIAPNRLVATQKAAKHLLEILPKNTKVGLATFSDYGTLSVPLTTDRQDMIKAIDNLSIGGGYSFSYGMISALEALPEKSTDDAPPGAIIIFTHGHDRSGNDPIAIADEAAKRGIPIFTVGVGTHGGNFSEDILKIIAERTGGQYYPIFSAGDLLNAPLKLAKIITLRPKTTEVTARVSLAAALLLALSLLLSGWRRM
jgi:Ca-activated chloride channel homolog